MKLKRTKGKNVKVILIPPIVGYKKGTMTSFVVYDTCVKEVAKFLKQSIKDKIRNS